MLWGAWGNLNHALQMWMGPSWSNKEITFPELVESGPCRLVVAIGTGRRWSDAAKDLFMLAFTKARE